MHNLHEHAKQLRSWSRLRVDEVTVLVSFKVWNGMAGSISNNAICRKSWSASVAKGRSQKAKDPIFSPALPHRRIGRTQRTGFVTSRAWRRFPLTLPKATGERHTMCERSERTVEAHFSFSRHLWKAGSFKGCCEFRNSNKLRGGNDAGR